MACHSCLRTTQSIGGMFENTSSSLTALSKKQGIMSYGGVYCTVCTVLEKGAAVYSPLGQTVRLQFKGSSPVSTGFHTY